MAQKKNQKALSTAQKVGLGIGLTAAAVTAAGAFFLYGSKVAPQNRKKVKSWMFKAKGEILEALEKAEAITEAEYRTLVKNASDACGSMQKATKGEMKEFATEMQDHWKKLQKSAVVKKMTAPLKKTVQAKAPVAPAPRKSVAKKPAPQKTTK